MKYAAAIRPLQTNAAGLENSPTAINTPPVALGGVRCHRGSSPTPHCLYLHLLHLVGGRKALTGGTAREGASVALAAERLRSSPSAPD